MFQEKFRSALEQMIDKNEEDYSTIEYSDNLTLEVWSHEDGEGSFELYVNATPHRGENVLSPERPNVEELYEDVDEVVQSITGKDMNIVFYLIDTVVYDERVDIFATHELTAY